jgi:hypothetical protein
MAKLLAYLLMTLPASGWAGKFSVNVSSPWLAQVTSGTEQRVRHSKTFETQIARSRSSTTTTRTRAAQPRNPTFVDRPGFDDELVVAEQRRLRLDPLPEAHLVDFSSTSAGRKQTPSLHAPRGPQSWLPQHSRQVPLQSRSQ